MNGANMWLNYYPCGYYNYNGGHTICKINKNITPYRMGKNSIEKIYNQDGTEENKKMEDIIEKFENRGGKKLIYGIMIYIIIIVILFFLFS